MDWLEIVKELGPYAGIIFFFIWRDYRREEGLKRQVDSQGEFIRTVLLDTVKEANQVMKEAAEAMKRV